MADRTARVVFMGDANQLNATLAETSAKLKALADLFEEQNAKIAAGAEASSVRFGNAFDKGTTKASNAFTKLSRSASSWGIPFAASLEKMGQEFDSATSKTQKFHSALESAGKLTLAAGMVGFVAAAGEGLKIALDFQKQMELLHTQAGATQAEVKRMSDAVDNMSGSVATGPDTLAAGLYHIESTGLRGAKALGVLHAAAEGAKIGGANLEDVTNALDAAVVSGISGIHSYTGAMGMLNATVGAGDMRMQDLADALSTGLLASARNAGVSIRDVGAALAVFGDNNMRGAVAATRLRMALTMMAAPSTTAAKALAAIGLSTTALGSALRAGGPSGGLVNALAMLKQHLAAAGATAAQQEVILSRVFGGGRTSAGAMILMDQLDRMRKKYADVGAGAGKMGEDWKATTQTLQFKIDQLQATVQGLADKFGTFLIPKLQAAGQAVSSVVSWFEKNRAAAQVLAAVVAGVLGAAIGAYVGTKVLAFISGTQNMIVGMGKLVSGIELGTGKIVAKLGLLGPAAQTAEAEMASAEGEMVATADATATGIDGALLSTGIGAAFVALGVAAGELLTHWQTVMSAMESAVNAMARAVNSALNGVIGALNAAISVFNSTIGQLTGDIGKVGSVGFSSPFGGGAGSGNMLNGPGGTSVSAGRNASNVNFASTVSGRGPVWKRIASALAGQGFSRVAIAGILGNMAQESGGTTLQGINAASGNGSMGGFGLVGFTGVEAEQEKGWAQAHKLQYTSLLAQMEFLLYQLRTTDHNVFQAVQNANSPAQAAKLFMDLFEKPLGYNTNPYGTAELQHRTAAADLAYRLLGPMAHDRGHGGGGPHNPTSNALKRYLAGKTRKARVHDIRTLLYENPLAGDTYNVERTDQGKDFGDIHGMMHAIGAGVVTLAQNLSGFGETIVERLTSGPDKGRSIYYGMETGAAGIGIRQGQRLRAGQAIARGLGTGGVELGFWNPATGRSMGAPYFNGSNATPPGIAFAHWIATMHPGIYTTTNTKTGITTGGGSNVGFSISQAIQTLVKQLDTQFTALLTKLDNLIQAGTPTFLEKALGVSTRGRMTVTEPHYLREYGGHRVLDQFDPTVTRKISTARAIHNIIEGLGPTATMGQISRGLSPTLNQAAANSPQTRVFNTLVASLIQAGQVQQAKELVAAHRQAMATLAQEMYALQVTKDADSIQLQATQEKDQTQLISDTFAKWLAVSKDESQLIVDAMQAAATAIKDMTQTITDRFAAMAQKVTDDTTLMADASNAVVQGISDQTQIQVDILGERGLYGLNLIAQQEQVQLDVLKAGFDRQIAAAQQQLDATKATWNATVATKQAAVDQVQRQQDANVALVQQHTDTVQLAMDMKVAQAQAHADSVALAQDVNVQLAQTAVDLSANAPKAQQDATNAALKRATAVANLANAGAARQLTDAQGLANAAITQAQGVLAKAQGQAAIAEANAQQALATAQGQAALAVAQATASLQEVQDTAAQAEAQQQALISVTQAKAQTEFAGSGLVVNMYGIPVENATAVGAAMDWFARTSLNI